MLVVSGNLVLSPAEAALGPNNPIVLWRNLVTAAGIVADTAAAGYPATNLANPLTHLDWRAADGTAQYLTVTTNEVDPIDAVGVAKHNFGSAEIAPSIEGYIGAAWQELVPAQMPPDDAPLLFRFSERSLERVRIKLPAGIANARAAVVYVGKLTVMQRRLYVGHVPLPMGVDSDVVNGISESGNFMGRIVLSQRVGTSAAFRNLTPAWVREHLLPFVAASRTRPFFFAWRPDDYRLEAGYAWMTNNPKPQNQRSNGMMSVELQMSGIAP